MNTSTAFHGCIAWGQIFKYDLKRSNFENDPYEVHCIYEWKFQEYSKYNNNKYVLLSNMIPISTKLVSKDFLQ
jgi:hypothetical protein